jgi:hypothetical protein
VQVLLPRRVGSQINFENKKEITKWYQDMANMRKLIGEILSAALLLGTFLLIVAYFIQILT